MREGGGDCGKKWVGCRMVDVHFGGAETGFRSTELGEGRRVGNVLFALLQTKVRGLEGNEGKSKEGKGKVRKREGREGQERKERQTTRTKRREKEEGRKEKRMKRRQQRKGKVMKGGEDGGDEMK